ncbi:IclR family transcriptional regulator [Deinococcus roseus]|uniref:IclR family transcriptional regulator n=1 Tax=Deinococcus roseus TaxID=392414 RepID=A0ABQ2CZR1_9DEIO|nr:IclR family transcriptional regulator [Deinococcus roseus]GGJ25723.1 IclR family transcriptional regulator [Deinococcus roseus]
MLDTLQKSAQILKQFTSTHPEWGTRELAAHLQQPKSTVHLHLQALTQTGFLRKTPRNKYALSWRLLEFSGHLHHQLGWYQEAVTAMQKLAEEVKALSYLCVLEGQDVLCIARAHSESEEHREIQTDLYLPTHATAAGKIFAAFCSLPIKQFQKFTPSTITTPDEWETALKKIRQDRYALSLEEWVPDSCALAAPLFQEEKLVAVLGLQVKTFRFKQQKSNLLHKLLHNTDHFWSGF